MSFHDGVFDSAPSYEVAKFYGMPHLNAMYTGPGIDKTRWLGDYPECAVCGMTHGSHAVHHEPERSKGMPLMKTTMGQFIMRPALILLCERCHADRHAKLLKIKVEWDSEEDEAKWWSGYWLSHGMEQHDPRLFEMMRYSFERDGRRWEVR